MTDLHTRLDIALTSTLAQPPARLWDGNLWGLTIAALPLVQDAVFALLTWQYDKGMGALHVRVLGEGTVETSDCPVAAWLVDAGDDPAQSVRYQIAWAAGAELGYSGGGMAQRLAWDSPVRS
jgi:hypothetical protein